MRVNLLLSVLIQCGETESCGLSVYRDGANLGVVDADRHRSFVMADIPGLIEGAAEGAERIRFLKHLARTRILLHIVDVQPIDGSDPAHNARAIVAELEKFSPTLAKLPIIGF